MNAQFLYDFRENWEFCSGTDLSEFFVKETGDPSLRGRVKVNQTTVVNFILSCLKSMRSNSATPRTELHVADAIDDLRRYI